MGIANEASNSKQQTPDMSGNTSISLSFFKICQQADINDQVRRILFIKDAFLNSADHHATRLTGSGRRPQPTVSVRRRETRANRAAGPHALGRLTNGARTACPRVDRASKRCSPAPGVLCCELHADTAVRAPIPPFPEPTLTDDRFSHSHRAS